jgi:two-component system chemotaxis sensor kinase CheA
MSDIDLNELMATFVDEAAGDIDALEAGLLALETGTEDAEVKRDLLRRAHTLKGSASCVGLNELTAFAHVYEDMLARIDAGTLQADSSLIALLLNGVDTFRRLVAGADDEPAKTAVVRTAGTLRVAAERLNRMLDLAGEIAIARGRVQQLLRERPDDPLIQVEQQIDTLQLELQELIMGARMVPIGTLFRQYARTVHDVAAAHGKAARLVTIGEDVELDTTAVELLRDPLTHMIRNAIDHGIETPSERTDAGKAVIAQVTLEARHEAGSIIIRVSDDGAGLDREAIAHRARTRGIDADRFAGNDIYKLIFEPGFSTAGSVSDLSGRGVGMDVVRRSIETLRGSIAIETKRHEGTTFIIRLPLTLAVIDGFGVTAASETYVVPMDHVLECIELPAAEAKAGATGVLLLRNEIVPYVRLRSLFALDAHHATRENVLVVQHDGAKAGLVVDELHGAGQAVIKPLGNYFNELPGIAGSSILGDGRVALILDAPAILRGLAAAAKDAA